MIGQFFEHFQFHCNKTKMSYAWIVNMGLFFYKCHFWLRTNFTFDIWDLFFLIVGTWTVQEPKSELKKSRNWRNGRSSNFGDFFSFFKDFLSILHYVFAGLKHIEIKHCSRSNALYIVGIGTYFNKKTYIGSLVCIHFARINFFFEFGGGAKWSPRYVFYAKFSLNKEIFFFTWDI